MKNFMESVRKDTIIIACKKRAKEILTIKKDLTFMQCLEIAAKEMQYNSWYELRSGIKQKVLKENNTKPILYFNEWDLFLKNFFAEDYESIHFEVRENGLEVRVRKYGLINVIDHNFSVEFMMGLIKEINLDPYNYDWLSKENYNIQTMPVHGKELNKNYDIVVVKKDIKTPFSGHIYISGVTGSGMSTTLKSVLNKELTFSEKLFNLGFNENHIKDIKRNWGLNNIFIAGVTGSGKSKTAETIIEELIKTKKVIMLKEGMSKEDFHRKMIIAMKSDPDYFYIPEIRDEESAKIIYKMIQSGYNIITTIHANRIDGIYQRIMTFGINLLEDAGMTLNNCLIYQKLEAILCPVCKEKEFSFKKLLQNEGFMSYVNKYEKHNEAEHNLYKKGSYENCKNDKCYNGFIGRKIIAETFATNFETVNDKKSESLYVHYHRMTNEEQKLTKNIERLKSGKISEYLKLSGSDFNSHRYEYVLKGEIEL